MDKKKFTKADTAKIQRSRSFKLDYSKVRNLEHIDDKKREFITYEKYQKIQKKLPIPVSRIERQTRPTFPSDLRYLARYSATRFPNGRIIVFVNYSLYPKIKPALDRYVRDLAYEGYFAEIYRVESHSPAALRRLLQSQQQALVGTLMIGNLPVAWYEMTITEPELSYKFFPCDLYFMDLNGQWQDSDNDNKFDIHSGWIQPEIWLGRLWTPDENGNNAELINDYFERNHLFRTGRLGCSNRALAFVDDDWKNFNDCAFSRVFPAANITTINRPTDSNPERYKAEIEQPRAWVQVCAHSSPFSHSFKIGDKGDKWGSVPNTHLSDINPPDAYFYNLFACRSALFTQSGYMGGWYIFGKKTNSPCGGLCAVGSTTPGSMLYFENFYGPMRSGRSIGHAYRQWWRLLGNDHTTWMRSWFYGLTLLGDPTLNYLSGAVPVLRRPYNEDVFDHYPREMVFSWDSVPLPNVRYIIEIDAYGAVKGGSWAEEHYKTFFVSKPLSQTSYHHSFVGAQRGRWRVRVQIGQTLYRWSDWQYFRFNR